MYRLDYRMQEVKSVKSLIDQDARLMFGGMLERLESAEGYKNSILQHEMGCIQEDIDGINSIIEQVKGLAKEDITPLEFMIKAPVIKQNIEYLLNKTFKTDIEVYPYDLPRELYHIRQQIDENTQLENLLSMKDQVIFSLLMKMKNIFGESVVLLDESANQEISSWAALTDRYIQQLDDFQRICYYCAEPLNENSVNTDCMVNVDKQLAHKFKGFTEKEPTAEYHGTFRHYFHKPKQEILSSPEAFENLQRIFFKKENNPYKQSLVIQVEKIITEIRKKVFKEHIELSSIFREDDKQGLGIIKSIAFTYLLNEHLGVSEEKIVSIIKLLDPGNKNLINYMDFIRLVHDQSSLDQMPLFKLGEQAKRQMDDKQRELFAPSRQVAGNTPQQQYDMGQGGANIHNNGQSGMGTQLPLMGMQGGIPMMMGHQMDGIGNQQGGQFRPGQGGNQQQPGDFKIPLMNNQQDNQKGRPGSNHGSNNDQNQAFNQHGIPLIAGNKMTGQPGSTPNLPNLPKAPYSMSGPEGMPLFGNLNQAQNPDQERPSYPTREQTSKQ